MARVALLIYLLVQWPRQARMAKGILLVTLLLAGVVVGGAGACIGIAKRWTGSVSLPLSSRRWACCVFAMRLRLVARRTP